MDSEPSNRPSWISAITRHPVISAILVVCTLTGAVVGYAFLVSAAGSPLQAIVGSAVGGAGVGLLITATRLLG
jgi:RsiW-degrading membrane proteinase PrsW (M82 family)